MGPASDHALAAAADALRDGALVAFPTETVYGLGADSTNPRAVAAIFAAKRRPQFNPLIAHVTGRAMARREGRFTRQAELLAEAFWPGPLTLVVPRGASGAACDLCCAGLASIGVRQPAHPIAAALIAAVGRPVAAPSANRSGRLSPTTAADVRSELGDAVAAVLDGGACRIGIESTIVGCDEAGVTLLRPGGIAPDAIAAVIGTVPVAPGGSIVAPGMMQSHYAPNARLRLDASALESGETALDFAGCLGGGALDLSPGGNLAEAAANLYGFLRRLDAAGASTIAVAPLPRHGLGLAINDRLRRAAAPRD